MMIPGQGGSASTRLRRGRLDRHPHHRGRGEDARSRWTLGFGRPAHHGPDYPSGAREKPRSATAVTDAAARILGRRPCAT
jgi:hypothetical protein